jgi:LysM repeat protein
MPDQAFTPPVRRRALNTVALAAAGWAAMGFLPCAVRAQSTPAAPGSPAAGSTGGASVPASRFPVTAGQRQAAQQVAQAGVALEDLVPNAPDSHTVQRGDTLWDISKLFLKSPWRWPQLWGMNLDQIRNPHLIYPGQILVLDKSSGRARLRMANQAVGGPPTNTVKLSPSIRGSSLDNGAIASVPMHLIGPFLNEGVVFESNELEQAPRIVATQEGRVLLSRGELAYVRGDLRGARDFRIFRQARPLLDPRSRELLGYEGQFVGAAELVREGGQVPAADGKTSEIVPATFNIKSIRQEANIGDRLWHAPAVDMTAFVPHAPAQAVDGLVVSIYGEGLQAGQNQIVAINRGQRDGAQRGQVMALWRAGSTRTDRDDPQRATLRLPDERNGLIFVFRVFERVSYALILNVAEPVRAGDRISQP